MMYRLRQPRNIPLFRQKCRKDAQPLDYPPQYKFIYLTSRMQAISYPFETPHPFMRFSFPRPAQYPVACSPLSSSQWLANASLQRQSLSPWWRHTYIFRARCRILTFWLCSHFRYYHAGIWKRVGREGRTYQTRTINCCNRQRRRKGSWRRMVRRAEISQDTKVAASIMGY